MMLKNIFVFISGLLFGIGLILSGMTNPNKVIHFLDITRNWDPSLFFVMLGAIPTTFIGFRWLEKRNKTILGEPLHLPGKTHITKQLIIGSFLFGAGWAIIGFCPGPALVSFALGNMEAFIFVCAMLIGMLAHDRIFIQRKN